MTGYSSLQKGCCLINDRGAVGSDDITLDIGFYGGSIFTCSQLTPELLALDPGSIMESDITPVAPNGFMRKVIAITTSGSQVAWLASETVMEMAPCAQ